jgi:hypothetical protein
MEEGENAKRGNLHLNTETSTVVCCLIINKRGSSQWAPIYYENDLNYLKMITYHTKLVEKSGVKST